MDIKGTSEFRLWVQRLWIENSEEHLTFHENPYTIKQYWNQHKYWIKRKYKQERQQNAIKSKVTDTV